MLRLLRKYRRVLGAGLNRSESDVAVRDSRRRASKGSPVGVISEFSRVPDQLAAWDRSANRSADIWELVGSFLTRIYDEATIRPVPLIHEGLGSKGQLRRSLKSRREVL